MQNEDEVAKNDQVGAESLAQSTLLNTVSKFGFPACVLILSLVLWALAFTAPTLLDESFLLNWLKESRSLSGSSGVQGFMTWDGFSKADSWGFVAHGFFLLLSILFGKSAFFYKLIGLLLHVGNSIMLFLSCRQISKDWFFPIFSATVFALYPLHFESVAWIPGLPTALSAFGFLSAFYIFLRARENGLKWVHTAAISALSFLALASSLSIWPAFLAFGLFELFSWLLPLLRGEKRSGDPTMTMITCLLPIVITGAYCAAAGGIMSAFVPDFKLQHFKLEYLSLFFPVNQLHWQKYSAEYRFFYLAYGLLVVPAFFGLSMNRQAKRMSLLSLLLFLLFSVPFVGVAVVDSSLYGERFLYLASIGFSMLLGSLLSASALLQGRWKLAGALAGSAVALLFFTSFARHSWNEVASNRNSARALQAMQKSLRILAEKNGLPLLLVRDLPDRLGLVPSMSVHGPVAFDSASGMLRSNPVPDGRLKELLRKNVMRDAALRWESNLKSFLPLNLSDQKLLWTELNPEKITERMDPGIAFYKNIQLSADKKELLLESNSENGPMVTLFSGDLDTLDQDYLYVDAQINAPTSFASPRVELHYLTRVHEDYDDRERFTYVDATINDGKVHRYKLSLRANGWTSGGIPKHLALGFPAGARVSLRAIGVISRADDIATLQPSGSLKLADLSRKRFTPPYFNYPYNQDLGLIPLADASDSIKAEFSVEHVNESAGILAELSWPNKSFDDANSNHGSSACFKTYRQSGRKGELTIPLRGLPGPGVYSLRIIGSGENGNYLGQFSDPICFQVPTVPASN